MTANWTSYRLTPDDLLFFRDGRPSTIGEDHFLQSIFPLHPATLYGAVRTARLVEEGHDLSGLNRAAWRGLSPALRSEIGEWGSFGTLELRGPWLERNGDHLFPAPADLGVVSEQTTRASRRPSRVVTRAFRFRPDASSPDGGWSHDYLPLRPYVRENGGWTAWDGETPESPSGWFVTASGMQSWLAGDVPAPADFAHASELWQTEIRSGVGLEDSSRTAKKGSLYTFGFIRLSSDVSVGFELRNGSLAWPARLRLGGEGKTARVEAGVPLDVKLPVERASGLRTIYVATPAFSIDGSRAPAAVSSAVAAAVRGATLVGGWDLAKRASKPLRRAIPAGSVYFAPDGESIAQLHGHNISDVTEEHEALQGFGLAFTGSSH